VDYKLKKPCSNCPFVRVGGVRLTASRIHEIAGGMLSNPGIEFVCHKTVRTTDDEEEAVANCDAPGAQHCAGALIFAEKNGHTTQMMRIAERTGWNPEELQGHEYVYDTIDEMFENAYDSAKRNKEFTRVVKGQR
jgi:hypothetical protein